jgi:hypothetical protein
MIDMIGTVLVWFAENWFPIALGAALSTGIVTVKNVLAK